MRAEPPPPPPRHERGRRLPLAPRQRCPYLEQLLREGVLLGLLTRYKADCHVDRRTHRFTGRHPTPPCITEPQSCRLYGQARAEEDRRIARWTD